MYSAFLADDFAPTIAVGTNLLEWAGFRPDFSHTTVIPNIYVEYYFLKRWSAKLLFPIATGPIVTETVIRDFLPTVWNLVSGGRATANTADCSWASMDNWETITRNAPSKTIRASTIAADSPPAICFRSQGLAIEVNVRAGYRHATVKKYDASEECSNLCRKYDKNEFTITGSFLNLLYRFLIKDK